MTQKRQRCKPHPFSIVITCIMAIVTTLGGCGQGIPVQLEFGPAERAMLKQLTENVDKGINDFNIRGRQAIDVFDRMPNEFQRIGAELIQFQLTEWTSAVIGKTTAAIDCSAENVQQRCIKNLEMIKVALNKAVDEVNRIEKEKSSYKEKVSKWSVFLSKLKFKPVMLDPHICYLDQEQVQLKFTNSSASEVSLLVPNNGVLVLRGTGLQFPRESPDFDEEKREFAIEAHVVLMSDGTEVARTNITKCIRHTLPNTIQFDLNLVKDAFKPADSYAPGSTGPAGSYIEVVTKSEPKKKIKIASKLNEIPIVYRDPDKSDTPPPATVTSLILSGRTDGDDKDPGRGFLVNVCAGITSGNEINVVASMPKYCYDGEIKDQDFPHQRFENLKPFPVPDKGSLYVLASEHHDCECYFTLEYTIQTYRWGDYDRAKKAFAVIPDRTFNKKWNSPKHFFRGDEGPNKADQGWAFNWEGP